MPDRLSNHEKLLQMRLFDFIKLVDIDYDIDSIAKMLSRRFIFCPPPYDKTIGCSRAPGKEGGCEACIKQWLEKYETEDRNGE